ncbi:cupin domain-containing protein [Candidatus Uhrbacteria bacterium]|nr:cupin domain-containing protein [Candidatus Uhrbacteria bacterium]
MFSEPKRVEKPWGYEIWFAHTEAYVGKVIHVDKGAQLSLQYHEKKDETMYCLSGEAILVYEKNGVLVEEPFLPGTSFHVLPGMKHRLKAGHVDCDVLEASTSQVDDVVRLQDDYGRG